VCGYNDDLCPESFIAQYLVYVIVGAILIAAIVIAAIAIAVYSV
jgi:hypothetical protein